MLPHPVELLTIEQAARRASVPKTTIDSAVSGSEQFRSMVFAEAILALPVEPGPAVWAALRRGMGSGYTVSWLADLLTARAGELAGHPSLALFLSGYDYLEDQRVADAVHWLARELLDRFLPFVETVIGGAEAGEEPLFDAAGEMLVLHVLLVEGYRRMVGLAADDAATDRQLSCAAARIIEAEVEMFQHERSERADQPLLPRPDAPPDRPEGRLRDAVRAGAILLVEGHVPLSIGMTVDDVVAAAGISVATFYRRFGSVGAFERALLDRVGREVLSGFSDEFFAELLEGVRAGEIEARDAMDVFNASGSATTWRHIEEGRPGHQLTPWLGFAEGRKAFHLWAVDTLSVRAEFYEEFTKLAGGSLVNGLTGRTVAEILGTHSTVAVALTRASVDRDRGLELLLTRLPIVNAQLFA